MSGNRYANEDRAADEGRAASANPVVRMRSVSKTFGETRALDSVSLDVPAGRIVGLLGANAAGKSTLLRHMIGLYLPDSGICETLGRNAADLGSAELERIGYVHQEGELLDWMKAGQLIRYVRAYYPKWNPDLETRLIADFEINLGDRVRDLSPGQRQRLAIVLAVCFEPELLILDEPAAALDPLARAQFLDLLLQMIQQPGRTILISSHILSDVEKVIDHVLIMKKGRIVCDRGFDDLREEFLRVRLTSLGGPLPPVLPFGGAIENQTRRDANEAVLILRRPPSLEHLEDKARQANCAVETRPLSLEEIYAIVVA